MHLIFSFCTGGAETMLVDIVNEQCKKADISLIIINNLYKEELLNKIDNRVSIIKIDRKPRSKNIFRLFKLNWILFNIRPDFIHCHNYKAIILILRKIISCKIGLTVHELGVPCNLHSCYDIIFAISNAVMQDIKKKINLDVIVVDNGIDFIKIKQKNNLLFNNNENIFKIIQVSRLEHNKKGQDILIRAISILVNDYNYKNISLDFIGEGKSEEYLKELVEELKLEKYIHFLGLKDREYIYSNLCNYNLLIQPSRFEGFGLTIVEAMAAKIPVLVSDIGGPKEIINNGKFGYMFKKNSFIDCAEKILTVIREMKNPNYFDKINNTYDVMKSKYDISITANKYLRIYKGGFTWKVN